MLLPICCCLSCQPETDDNKLSTNGDVRGQFLSINLGTTNTRENSLKIKPCLSVKIRETYRVQNSFHFDDFFHRKFKIYCWTRDHLKMTQNESPLKFTSFSGKDYNLGCVLELENFSTVIIIIISSEAIVVVQSCSRVPLLSKVKTVFQASTPGSRSNILKSFYFTLFTTYFVVSSLLAAAMLPYLHFLWRRISFIVTLKMITLKKDREDPSL